MNSYRSTLLALGVASALGTACASSPGSPKGGEVAVSTNVDAQGAIESCPSALPGANTSSDETADGIALDITSDDPLIVENIRALAKRHATMRPARDPDIVYTTWGSGGEACPIVHGDTDVSTQNIEGGARVHMSADDDSAPELRALIQQRVGALGTDET